MRKSVRGDKRAALANRAGDFSSHAGEANGTDQGVTRLRPYGAEAAGRRRNAHAFLYKTSCVHRRAWAQKSARR